MTAQISRDELVQNTMELMRLSSKEMSEIFTLAQGPDKSSNKLAETAFELFLNKESSFEPVTIIGHAIDLENEMYNPSGTYSILENFDVYPDNIWAVMKEFISAIPTMSKFAVQSHKEELLMCFVNINSWRLTDDHDAAADVSENIRLYKYAVHKWLRF